LEIPASISRGGALLEISYPEQLPERISIYYDDPAQDLGVIVAWCRVVRTSVDQAAVQFVYSGTVSGVHIPTQIGRRESS
jgi:hypothetical protein